MKTLSVLALATAVSAALANAPVAAQEPPQQVHAFNPSLSLSAPTNKVVCVKFSKLILWSGCWWVFRSIAVSLCSIGNDHPFVPTCLLAERRAQRQSRMMSARSRRHRRSRRAASLTERARC